MARCGERLQRCDGAFQLGIDGGQQGESALGRAPLKRGPVVLSEEIDHYDGEDEQWHHRYEQSRDQMRAKRERTVKSG